MDPERMERILGGRRHLEHKSAAVGSVKSRPEDAITMFHKACKTVKVTTFNNVVVTHLSSGKLHAIVGLYRVRCPRDQHGKKITGWEQDP